MFALARALWLAGASTTTITDLRTRPGAADAPLERALREASRDPAVGYWDGDMESFLHDYHDAYREFVEQALAFADDTNPDPDRSDLDKADYRLRLLTNVFGRTLETVSFLRLQYAFERSTRPIAVALVSAATGAVAFAWATTGV